MSAAATMASPCVDVCQMNERSGLCEGCWRTIDEIAAWSTMDDAQKRRVWALLPDRQHQHFDARGPVAS